MDHTQINKNIASQLKAQRKDKGWSLDKTAQATGVSKAMLGQIERGESSPTIATLWKIATGLSCSFSAFITQQDESMRTDGPVQQPDIKRDPNMQVKTLFPFSQQTRFETFEITLTENHTQHSEPHQAGVTEHLHVLEGELQVAQGETWHTVNAGEQFILSGDQPHAYRDNAGVTRFLDIIYYPL